MAIAEKRIEVGTVRMTHNTGGHSETEGTRDCFDILDKIISDPRFDLPNSEVTVNYIGRDKGNAFRPVYQVFAVDTPPSVTVTLVMQPRGNDTCGKYKVMAAGVSGQDLAERFEAFKEYVQRDKGNWRIIGDEAAAPLPSVTYATGASRMGTFTSERAVVAVETKKVAGPMREWLLEKIRWAGKEGISAKKLAEAFDQHHENRPTTIATLVQPLITKGLVIKPSKYIYRIATVDEALAAGNARTDVEGKVPLTKTQRVKLACLQFLQDRPGQKASTEHLRQQAAKALGEPLGAGMLVKSLSELTKAGKIKRRSRGRYELIGTPTLPEEPEVAETEPINWDDLYADTDYTKYEWAMKLLGEGYTKQEASIAVGAGKNSLWAKIHRDEEAERIRRETLSAEADQQPNPSSPWPPTPTGNPSSPWPREALTGTWSLPPVPAVEPEVEPTVTTSLLPQLPELPQQLLVSNGTDMQPIADLLGSLGGILKALSELLQPDNG